MEIERTVNWTFRSAQQARVFVNWMTSLWLFMMWQQCIWWSRIKATSYRAVFIMKKAVQPTKICWSTQLWTVVGKGKKINEIWREKNRRSRHSSTVSWCSHRAINLRIAKLAHLQHISSSRFMYWYSLRNSQNFVVAHVQTSSASTRIQNCYSCKIVWLEGILYVKCDKPLQCNHHFWLKQ